MNIKFLPVLILIAGFIVPVYAQPFIDSELFTSGLSDPIGIVHAGDDRLFIVEQRGTISIVTPDGEVMDEPFLNVSDLVSQSGFERGLLGLAFHPAYHENGFFFVNYTRETDGHTVVARFSVDQENADRADRESEYILFTVEQPYGNHNGGQLLFGPDGYLYIALGDGGSAGDPENRAQNRQTLLGKMLRIDVDTESDSTYAIPPDNPFVEDETTRDEIWAVGLRNPWRNSFDRLTGDFWIADVGQGEREEINFQPAGSSGGENYGWRCYEGDQPFNQEDCDNENAYVFPVFAYDHQGEGCTGSVTGGYVYRGAMYDGLFGAYFFADYCTGNVYRILPADDGFEGTLIEELNGGEISSFGEDLYGELYFAMKNSGEIYKISDPDDCNPVAFIMHHDSVVVIEPDTSVMLQAVYNPSLEYQWLRNDEPLEGETGHELEVTLEGIYTVQVSNTGNECTNVSNPVEVTIISTSSGLTELAGVLVYPNPVINALRIEGLPATGTAQISLFDSRGVLVHNETAGRVNTLNISLSATQPGIYHLRIIHESGTFQRKIVVAESH